MSCHGIGSAPRFTVAGTLYKPNGTALSGATITVVDSANTKVNLVTHRNGNFYTARTLRFPIRVVASKCPDAAEMVDEVNDGNCNKAGCHASAGGTGRITLP